MHTALTRTIASTRRRIRLQRGLEALTTAGLIGVLAATVLVYLLKARIFSLHHFWIGIACAGGAVALAGIVSALRRVPASHVAKLIDDSHDLHDRLGTALEFSGASARTDFMRAQIEDAARHAPGVAAKRAAPVHWPRDVRALGLLLLCLAIVIVLRFPTTAAPVVTVRPVQKLEIDPEELEPHRALAKQLQKDADEQNQPELSNMAQELNKLFDQIERKELTKKELFAKLAELEKKYMDGMDGNFDDLMKKLKKVGDELQKDKLTKEIGEALKQAELKKAKEELDKLAKQIDKLKQQEKKQLARTLDKAAQQKLDKNKDGLQKKKDELEKQIRRLQKQQKQNPKDEQTRRRLEKKQRQLERLNQEQQRQAEQRRQLERLNQQMQQAAQSLRQNLSPEAQKALQQLAQQMGKFAQQLSKLGMQGKAQGQLSDLKELLRRLGQGQKGQQGKLQDFLGRCAGGKLGMGKPGQGKDGKDGKKGMVLDPNGKDGTLVMPLPGQGQGQQPGQAGQGQDDPNGQPGNGIGTSTNPNFMGKASNLKSVRKDQFVRGKESKGPTRSEVILGAAEKGFSSQSYRRVFQDYSQVIEDALKQEDVPLGYKYFVKRYFQLIKPR